MVSLECSLAIKNAVGKEFSDEDITKLVAKLEKSAAALRARDGTLTEAQAMDKAAQQMGEDAIRKAYVQQADRNDRVAKRADADKYIDAHPGGQAKAIESLVVPVNDKGAGSASSAENLIHAQKSKFRGGLDYDLQAAKLYEPIKQMDRDGQRNLWREMSRIRGGLEADTGDKIAKELAAIYHRWTEVARTGMNDAGAYIRSLEGYIVKQSHDQMKILSAGFDQWHSFVSPRLAEQTFEDVGTSEAARLEFLRRVYNNLSTGQHLKGSADEWLKGAYAGGRANIARRASEDRLLFFKDADSSFDYHESFGSGTIHDVVVGTLEKSGRDIALMDKLTSHPQSFLEGIYRDRIKKAVDNGDHKLAKELGQKSALKYLNVIDGNADQVGNPTWAKWMRRIRGYETITKLIGGAINQISDVPTMARKVENFVGKGFGEAIGGAVSGIGERAVGALSGGMSLEKRAQLVRAGSATDGFIGRISNRFDAGDKWDGRWAQAVEMSQKLNLQRPYTDTLLDIATDMLSSGLGVYKDLKLSELPRNTQIEFGRHGVTESIWDHARANTITDENGRHLIISDAIHHESDGMIRQILGDENATDKAVRDYRKSVELPLRNFFVSGTREAMTEVGARTRYLVTGGGQGPGTLGGELARTLTQFLSFPLEYIHTHLMAESTRYGQVQYGGLVKMATGMTMAGYLSNTLNDALHGKTPETPTSPTDASGMARIGLRAFARGGAMSFLGDILAGNASQSPAQAASKFFGPTASEVGALVDLYQNARDRAAGISNVNMASRSIRYVTDHVPIINNAYIQGAMQYLILSRIQEAVNPGYLARSEHKLQREHNQSYFVPRMAGGP